MLFNSLRFLFVFLPITVLGFHLLGRYGRRPVIAWLALMSVVFYAAWNFVFVFFLLVDVVFRVLGVDFVFFLVLFAGSCDEKFAWERRDEAVLLPRFGVGERREDGAVEDQVLWDQHGAVS